MRPIDNLDMSNLDDLDNLGGLGRAIGARPSACDPRQAEAPRPGRRGARGARRLQSRTALSGWRGVGVRGGGGSWHCQNVSGGGAVVVVVVEGVGEGRQAKK